MSDLGSHGSSLQFRAHVATLKSSLGCVRRNVTMPSASVTGFTGLVSSSTGADSRLGYRSPREYLRANVQARVSGLTGEHSDSSKFARRLFVVTAIKNRH